MNLDGRERLLQPSARLNQETTMKLTASLRLTVDGVAPFWPHNLGPVGSHFILSGAMYRTFRPADGAKPGSTGE